MAGKATVAPACSQPRSLSANADSLQRRGCGRAMGDQSASSPDNRNPFPPTAFFATTGADVLFLVFFGGFTAFCLVLGPLFLFGVIQPADGKPGTNAGIAVSLVGLLFFLPVSSLAIFSLFEKRRPVMRICREGLECRLIGDSSAFSRVPFVPVMVRLLWLILLLQGFRQHVFRTRWDQLRAVQVTFPPRPSQGRYRT